MYLDALLYLEQSIFMHKGFDASITIYNLKSWFYVQYLQVNVKIIHFWLHKVAMAQGIIKKIQRILY